jgi:transposase
MSKALQVELSADQVHELEGVRDHHPKAYLRERASAILKVAGGQSAKAVAESGLLKGHEPETVSGWVKAYQERGLTGLIIKPGRGRKPVFFPQERGARPRRSQ